MTVFSTIIVMSGHICLSTAVVRLMCPLMTIMVLNTVINWVKINLVKRNGSVIFFTHLFIWIAPRMLELKIALCMMKGNMPALGVVDGYRSSDSQGSEAESISIMLIDRQ